MTKRIILLFIYFISQFGLGQDFQWVRQIKGITHPYNDYVEDIVVDNNENTYTLGHTESRLFDIDPTLSGEQIIDNLNVNHSPFIGTYLIKTDSYGNYVWGLTFGTYKSDYAKNIKIGTDGNIYVLLSLAEFNTVQNVIDTKINILKISPAGTILSTFILPQNYNSGNLFVDSFDLDNQNNFLFSGYFIGNININSSINLSSTGIGNYLFKVNNDGTYNWIKQFNISSNSSSKLMIRPDNNINLLVGNHGNANYVLYNINNSNGNIIWEKNFLNHQQNAFHVSNNGIIILGTKNCCDVVDIDPSTNVYNIQPQNSYLIFLDLNGNFQDAKQFYNPLGSNLDFFAISTDIEGNYYLGGQFVGSIDFDPSNNTQIQNSINNFNAFYLKLDTNKNFDNIKVFGQELPQLSPFNICSGLKIKKIKIINHNSYMIGEFYRVCDFDPSPTSQNSLNSITAVTINQDGFILKLGQCDSTQPATTNNQTFCSSQNPTVANLSPNSSNFNWYINATSTVELLNTNSLINGQTYYVSRQNGSCPESPRTPVTVTINPTPMAPISSNQIFCESQNASLNDITISGQNIKWYSSNSGSMDLPTNTILQNNTTYYASQTINGCESTRTPILITITPNPLPTITSPQTFCIQQNATLNDIALTGQNIKWYDALTNGNLLSNTTPLGNGTTYYASQTINGCESNRTPVTIQIQNTPTPIGNANQSFCSTANATVSDIIINGTNVNWYNATTSTIPLANNTLLTNNTTYFATQTINGCESVNRLAVTISLINTLNATNYSEVICDDLNNNTEIINLSNYNSNLIASTGNTYSYYNSYNSALNQNSVGQINNFTSYNLALGTNTFYVRIDSPNTCFQIVTLTLELVSKPIIPINDMAPICEGSFITLNGGNNYDSYSWSTGATSQTITITQPGNYSVVVTESHGATTCTSTKNFTVVNSNIATIKEIISSDWTENNNTITVLLNSNSQGNYEYSINGTDFQNSNIFDNLETGEYTVFVRDKNGCGIVSEELYLLMYPKFFTPNGDGYNDYWKIKFSENEPNLTIKIFDRYGKFLKQLGANSIGWDGKYLGKDLPSSDYWFVVTRENGKEYKGHFSLKR